jgi:REP element-mobilizing transposase RayT/biotin operon repressor
MPRKARIDAPGALHHIIIRGIERKPIFKDNRDYQNFIERLGNILTDTNTPCYAWTLMQNHVHLLLRTGLVSISTVMRRLLTGYAQQFNRRHDRHGHLFQNRYKSILCQEDPYLLELVRYIHLNPIRAQNVKNLKALNSYPCCGQSALMGKVKHQWQDTDYVLRLFGKTVSVARKAYSNYISDGVATGRRPDLVGGGLIRSHGGWAAIQEMRSEGLRVHSDERVLGGSDFVESVLKKANENLEKKTLVQTKGIELKHLIEVVTNHFDLNQRQLIGQSRKNAVARARSIICSLAIDKLMNSGADVARELNLSPSAVSKLASRGRKDNLSEEIEKKLLGD